jgi:hypothetical protein
MKNFRKRWYKTGFSNKVLNRAISEDQLLIKTDLLYCLNWIFLNLFLLEYADWYKRKSTKKLGGKCCRTILWSVHCTTVTIRNFKSLENPIDISWLDWAYKSSTCYVLYRRSATTYIMVVKFRNTIWPPPPQLSLHRRSALSSNSNGTRSVYSRESLKISLYCEMSMENPRKLDVELSPCTELSALLFHLKVLSNEN